MLRVKNIIYGEYKSGNSKRSIMADINNIKIIAFFIYQQDNTLLLFLISFALQIFAFTTIT